MKKRLIYICMFASLLTFSSCNEALDVARRDMGDTYSEGGYWQLYWGQIRIINTFLQRAATAAIPRESDRDRWVAEAHVLRAYFYMELLKWYGPVPME